MDKQRILVIDDEDIVRRSCIKVLTPEGFEVETAVNGVEGLEKAGVGEYALVLTDLMMPDMDGMEFLKNIIKKQPEAKVIMMTGYSTAEHAVKAIKAGACNYIEKPFTPDVLMEAVNEALEECRQED